MSNFDAPQNVSDRVQTPTGADQSLSSAVNMANPNDVQSVFKGQDNSAGSAVSDSGQMMFSDPYKSEASNYNGNNWHGGGDGSHGDNGDHGDHFGHHSSHGDASGNATGTSSGGDLSSMGGTSGSDLTGGNAGPDGTAFQSTDTGTGVVGDASTGTTSTSVSPPPTEQQLTAEITQLDQQVSALSTELAQLLGINNAGSSSGDNNAATKGGTTTGADGVATTTPGDNTAAAAPIDNTTTTTPGDNTAAAAPIDNTTTAAPADNTAAAAPIDNTTTAAPADNTTAAAPIDNTTTAAPSDSTTAAAPIDNTTTSAPTDSTTAAAPTDGNYSVVGGKIIGPDGQPFDAKGVAVFAGDATADAATIMQQMPDLNFIRLAATPSSDTPADIQADIQAFQTINPNVNVEVEDHSSGGTDGTTDNTLHGQDLTNEEQWYSQIAAANVGNSHVMFGTANEPNDPSNEQNVVDQESGIYNAIRSTGNNNLVLMEADGGGFFGPQQADTSAYANMTNVAWDDHYYGWETNGDNSAQDNVTALQTEVNGASGITESNGNGGQQAIPTIIGEYGNSTTGLGVDSNATGAVDGVQLANNEGLVQGAIGWVWDAHNNPNGDSDAITQDGTMNTATNFGNEIINYNNTGNTGDAS